MKRHDHWELEYIYAPDGDFECKYSKHQFIFQRIPSRKDFEAVVRMLPWLQGQHDLLALIASHPWPVVGYGCKACTQELFKDEKHIGTLRVRKYDTWENDGYEQGAPFLFDIEQKILKGLRGENREKADRLFMMQHNEILEEIMQYPHREDTHEWILRKALHKAGLLKSKPKVPA